MIDGENLLHVNNIENVTYDGTNYNCNLSFRLSKKAIKSLELDNNTLYLIMRGLIRALQSLNKSVMQPW